MYLLFEGLLFAVGGYDGASRQCLSSVECYSPQVDKWTPVKEMSCRRSGAGRTGILLLIIIYEQLCIIRHHNIIKLK